MSRLHLYDKILSPVVTEKSTNLSEHNKIVFKVPSSANKVSLKKNIEKIFKVNVTKINIDDDREPRINISMAVRANGEGALRRDGGPPVPGWSGPAVRRLRADFSAVRGRGGAGLSRWPAPGPGQS